MNCRTNSLNAGILAGSATKGEGRDGSGSMGKCQAHSFLGLSKIPYHNGAPTLRAMKLIKGSLI